MNLKQKFLNKKIAMGLVSIAVFTTVTGFVWGQKSVQIVADGRTIAVSTMKSDPENILKQAGIQLEEKDEYRLSTQQVKDHTEITVYRAVPVSVTYDGSQRTVVTGKPTVGEVLADMGIQSDKVRVTPDLDTKITRDCHIKIVNIHEKISERTEELQYEIIRQPDARLEKGREEIIAHGETGTKTVMVKEIFEDGEKVREDVVEEKVIEPAKAQVVHVGTRDTVDTSRGAMRFRRVAYMEATAYLPSDGGGSGITASGMAARHGVVAVDPDVIPMGSRLYIPGYGVAIAADTGGAIRGNMIDLCMEDYGDAINFGRRNIKVYILE